MSLCLRCGCFRFSLSSFKGDGEEKVEEAKMFRRGSFLSFPMVIGAVVIGVVSGKAIFGPPLDEYWTKKQQEESAKKGDAGSS